MRRVASTIGICALISFPAFSSGQNVCIGKGGNPCTPEESRQIQEQLCKAEASPPNLSVASPARLTGALLDPTGAPIVFEKIMVQIKAPKTDTVLRSVPVDGKGHFDLGLTPAGQFRLIAMVLKDGKPGRLPLAEQPRALTCPNENDCRLEITIRFHGTDNPIDFCPPK
jgi:hypothetical protein